MSATSRRQCPLSRVPFRLRAASSAYFFFFNDTATTEIYTLSLHDALPIYVAIATGELSKLIPDLIEALGGEGRSEEHTSELQSLTNLVCRLLLEKKKKKRRRW